ncbi:AAA family ATPase [Nonomuraea fuscirosea]|uniref:AAA family ATPase n=1 Tax=Nonomuraea fuscirosea TaxID=1291556 RepID=UPI002DDBC643|nr:AAA family ATPase [Nonomuraea fuscirosea]WSA54676.1 AAA family ATPase [Nonomuraea fuscirosea]
MLFGRSAEIAAIDDLLGRARGGAGGALVLRGDAGVGKTALLDLAATRTGSMRVLRATGAEPESDLAFATLHQLLRPVTIPAGGLLDALPEPQREAVRGALGLAGAASGDRFLLAAGVLSLLAEASVPDGLVCVVDDFQWVDRASADALLFAARRLSTERIAMLLSVRGALPVKGLPSLTLGGLPPDAATALMNADITSATTRSGASAGAGVGVEAGVVRELVRLTGGNPLALREIVRLLSPAQLAGREPLPDPLPGGAQLFGEQVAALSPQARQVALLAAVEGDLDLVLRAAATLTPSPGVTASPRTDAGRAALHELEAAGLVSVSGAGVRFRHPLIRSAVHEAAAPADRRAVHAVLGGLCEGDRRAWHLAAAALGQDEEVAAALAATAARARERGGYGDAATALVRAAELTPDPVSRAARLKDAAVAAWLGGRPGQAESLLAEARERAGSDPVTAAEIDQLRGRFELNSGSAAEAVRILSAGESLSMLADAMEAASYVGDTEAMIRFGGRAAAHPEGFLRDVLVGIGLMLSGEGADGGGHGLLVRALGRVGELTEAAEFLWATAAASQLGEADLSAELAGRAGRVARVSGMAGQLPVVLEFVATGERISGRLAESQAISEEGLELAREAGYGNTVAAHLANLAVLAALRGEEETCGRLAREALAIAVPHRVGLRVGVAAYALAMLELGLGRFAAAHDRFTAMAQAGPGAGHPAVVWRSAPDRIEAAVGAGDTRAARAALEVYGRRSAHARTDESRALLARCHALVEDDAGGFEEALRLHANPFEAARTGLLLGERLRRAYRPGEARPRLRAAMETFEAAGARPWARRAQGELRAAGESAEPAPGPLLDALTPQELRIAGLVADGLSSKEIAARLFLSPRTVEYHLYKIYPKLGITTRTELARLVVLRKAGTARQDML